MNDVRKVGVVEGLLRSSSSSSNRSTLIWIPSERLVRSYNAKLNLTLFSFANPMTDTKTKTREAPKINIARGTTDPEIDSETCTKLDGVVGGVQPGERNKRQVSHFEMHFRDC